MQNGLIKAVDYKVGEQSINLTPLTVRQYLVSGDARAVTDGEVGMFMMMCKSQGLNPFNREAYLIKFSNKPATMITGKDTFVKRANRNPNYEGTEAGVIVLNSKGDIDYREGSFYIKGKEQLVGGWAKVHTKNKKYADMITVSYDEYEGRKNDGKPNSNWATRPGTMIRKVALVQALREAFPEDFGGLYTAEEMGVDDTQLDDKVIDIEAEQMKAAHVEEVPKPAKSITKNQVMQLAAEKELMTGKGKTADVSKLEALANENGISLRGMTDNQANELINILMNYNNEPVETDNNEPNEVDAEIVEDDSNNESENNENIENNSNEESDPF